MAKILSSRTVWVIIVMFLIGGVNSIHGLLPGMWLPLVDGTLGILGIYFKMSPSQNYGPTV